MLNKHAWLTEDEASCLAKYAQLSQGDFVELGTFEAGGTELIHENLDEKYHVWTIDCNPRECAIATMLRLDRAYMIIGNTIQAGLVWGTPVGGLFVDAGHRYEDVFGDYNSWKHTLSPESYLLFHDARNIDKSYQTLKGQAVGEPDDFICQANDGVFRFVNELLDCGEVELIEEVDSIAVVRKRANEDMDEDSKG